MFTYYVYDTCKWYTIIPCSTLPRATQSNTFITHVLYAVYCTRTLGVFPQYKHARAYDVSLRDYSIYREGVLTIAPFPGSRHPINTWHPH